MLGSLFFLVNICHFIIYIEYFTTHLVAASPSQGVFHFLGKKRIVGNKECNIQNKTEAFELVAQSLKNSVILKFF